MTGWVDKTKESIEGYVLFCYAENAEKTYFIKAGVRIKRRKRAYGRGF